MPSSVYEDVRRAVARCIPDDRVLRVHEVAHRIAAAHAGGEALAKQVAEQLLAAAIAARVPVALNGAVAFDLRDDEPPQHTPVPDSPEGVL